MRGHVGACRLDAMGVAFERCAFGDPHVPFETWLDGDHRVDYVDGVVADDLRLPSEWLACSGAADRLALVGSMLYAKDVAGGVE